MEPELKAFFAVKEKQARAFAAEEKKGMAPEVWPYFEAAAKGDWLTASNLYVQMAKRSYQFDNGPSSETDAMLVSKVWQPVNETFRAMENFSRANGVYPLLYGNTVLKTVPKGSVFFGESDAGRFIVTFMSKSHQAGDPFPVLTQNSLADALYTQYLIGMYSNNIVLPSMEDLQSCHAEYLKDVGARYKDNRLKPNENVQIVDGRVHAWGVGAVMGINSRMSKIIWERNPQRRFFIAQSQPTEWMQPYLSPTNLIMEMHHQPIMHLPQPVLEADHFYWDSFVGKTLGNWLKESTSVHEICSFAEKVYHKKNLTQFNGDPAFIKSGLGFSNARPHAHATVTFAKARSVIASNYFWRAMHTTDAEYKQRMLQEAFMAYRQSFALCPYATEECYSFVNYLLTVGHNDEARLVAQTLVKIDPFRESNQHLLRELTTTKH